MSKPKVFIGIDPGKNGGIALIYDQAIQSNKDVIGHEQFHTPLIGKEYNINDMVDCLMGSFDTPNYDEDYFCVIEKVHAMPGQGVCSMFSFGYGFGLWVGIIAALNIPYQLVAPQTWKKSLLQDTLKDKTASIVLAQQLFPDFHAKFKKDEALAEALLLAEYGRRLHGQNKT